MGLMDLLKTSDPMGKFYAAAEKSNIPQGGVTGAAFKAMFPHGLGNLAFGREPEKIPPLETPEGTALMADLASNMMVPGTFIGPKGLARLFGDDAAKGMLATAESKLAQGVPKESVFQELGVFKGPEGKWRYEIDDSGIDFNLDAIPAGKSRLKIAEEYLRGQGRTEQWPLGNPNVPQELQSEALKYADANPDIPRGLIGQAVNHDQLFSAYPDAPNIGLAIEKRMGLGGSYDPAENLISVGGGTITTNPRSTTLHELQHAVQGREGFAAGGSPNQWEQIANDRLVDLLGKDPRLESTYWKYAALDRAIEMGEAFDPMAYDSLESALLSHPSGQEVSTLHGVLSGDGRAAGSPVAHDLYQRLAGEAEARAVQDRMNMNMDQRRALFPEYAGRNDLIVRGLMSGGE